MFFKIVLPLAVAATLVSTGCRSRSADNPSAEADSVAVDTVPVVEAPAMLPDTVYPSVSALTYSVTVIDTLTSGVLDAVGDSYADAPGMLTFRGNAFRAQCIGSVKGEPTEFVVDWTYDTEVDMRETSHGVWGGGTGWTAQPVCVRWPDSIAARFRELGLVSADFSGSEIMVGSLCRKIYFLDFATGRPSRPAVNVVNPIKGSMSLDPTLNGNLYFGQGVPAERPFGAGVIDLWHNSVSQLTPEDHNAWRSWGAYDASPLRVGQFVFRVGENGTLYKMTVAPGELTTHSTLRYRVNGVSPGIEASMSQWRNRGYLADNHGNIVCVDLNTLRPVWHYAMGDDTDCTPVMAEESDGTYIYLGAEVDRNPAGPAVYVKLNALDGSEVWRQNFDAVRRDADSKHFDGGFYATSLLGAGNCSGLVYNSCVKNAGGLADGCFVAMDRATGEVAYTVYMRNYGWMSSVGFLSDNGRFYIVVGDSGGYLTLLDGIDGRIIARQSIGLNFESSPAVSGNSLIVGSRGQTIYKVYLK